MNSQQYLLFPSSGIAGLRERSAHPQLQAATQQLLARAEYYLSAEPFDVEGGNVCRHHQGRVLTLAIAYLSTQRKEFLAAAVRELDWAANQEDWSWTAGCNWSNLITGEVSMTFGLAYNWLKDHFTEDERSRIRTAAEEKGLRYYIDCTDMPNPASVRVGKCNWNTVTNGGAAVLALALRGESKYCEEVLGQAVPKMRFFWNHLGEDGGYGEGISYWRFGMRYGLMTALALRDAGVDAVAMGGVDAFAHPGVRNTGYFPIAFQPGHKLEMSFADSSARKRMPILYLLGKEYKNPDFVWYEDREPLPPLEEEGWPMEVFALLWRPLDEDWLPEARKNFKPKLARLALFPSIDWAMLAPSQPDPEYCLAFKSGSLGKTSHTHLDLNHVSVAVGDEYLLCDLGRRSYTADYFGPNRFSYYELDTRGHNTVLIGGKGQVFRREGRVLPPQRIGDCEYLVGVADGAYHEQVTKARRHLVFAHKRFWILLDEIETPEEQNVEMRFHTYGEILPAGEHGWSLQSNDKALDIILPQNSSTAEIQNPDEWILPVKVLSVNSDEPRKDFATVTVLFPRRAGEETPEVTREDEPGRIKVQVDNVPFVFEKQNNGWTFVG